MKTNKNLYIIIAVVALTLVGLYFWRTGRDVGSGEPTFSYPKEFKMTETAIDGVENRKRILVEGSEAGKGFEIIVLPFDEVGPLTKQRILQDLPDKIIKNEKNIKVGGGIDALAFESSDESIGATYEIWFVRSGFIYEARTYPEFGPKMEEILKTLKK
jgi:hypothetical protein